MPVGGDIHCSKAPTSQRSNGAVAGWLAGDSIVLPTRSLSFLHWLFCGTSSQCSREAHPSVPRDALGQLSSCSMG